MALQMFKWRENENYDASLLLGKIKESKYYNRGKKIGKCGSVLPSQVQFSNNFSYFGKKKSNAFEKFQRHTVTAFWFAFNYIPFGYALEFISLSWSKHS